MPQLVNAQIGLEKCWQISSGLVRLKIALCTRAHCYIPHK